MHDMNVQVNDGRKQHITANFVKRGLIKGEQAQRKEVKETEQKQKVVRQTYAQEEGREKHYS